MPHLDPSMSVGERIAAHRVYRGMTQEACAGLTGKSLSWWKKVEQGVRHVEKLSDLITISQVLRVRNLADLTGVVDVAFALDHQREHAKLPAVRAALFSTYDHGTDDPDQDAPEQPDAERLREQLRLAWDLWHGSARFYTRVGETLPGLVTEAVALHHTAEPDQRRTTAALLAEAYFLARHWLTKVNAFDLAWITADRASAAARETDDPALMAAAHWNLTALLNSTGRSEEAMDVATMGLRLLEPRLADGPEVCRSMWGALQLQAAIAAARCSDPGTAWRCWDSGDHMARRLGPDHVHQWTIFGQANVGAYAVAVPVELGKSSEAVSTADRFDATSLPSVERRARCLIDIARGYAGRRDDVAAVHVLQRAGRESPEEVEFSLVTHEVVREMLRRDRKTVSGDLRQLARQVGIVH